MYKLSFVGQDNGVKVSSTGVNRVEGESEVPNPHEYQT